MSGSKPTHLTVSKSLAERLTKLADGVGVQAVMLYGGKGSATKNAAYFLVSRWLGSAAEESLARGTNPDLLHVRPRGLSRLITTAQIRPKKVLSDEEKSITPLTDFMRTRPLTSRSKVVWIQDADRMVTSAVSALLKPLEEPGDWVKLVLTTEMIGAIPATIKSRTLAIGCEQVSLEQIQSNLHEVSADTIRNSDFDEDWLGWIARKPELSVALDKLSDLVAKQEPGNVLLASDMLKGLADAIVDAGKAEGVNARAANAKAVELLATNLIRRHPQIGNCLAALSESHRRILGNGSAALNFDSLMASVLIK